MKNHKNAYQKFAAFILMLVPTLLFFYRWITELNLMQDEKFNGKGNWLMLVVFFFVLWEFCRTFGALRIGYYKYDNLVLSQILSLIATHVVMYFVALLVIVHMDDMGRIAIIMLQLTGMDIVISMILTYILLKIYLRVFPAYQMLEVCGDYDNKLDVKISARADHYDIKERIHYGEEYSRILELASRYDAVLLNDVPSTFKNQFLKDSFRYSLRVYYTPKLPDIMMKNSSTVELFDSVLFLNRNQGLTLSERFFKRFMDILISLLILIITSPILLVASIAIKAEDHGPVFFRQERCTMGGKKFMICKFRSMIVDAEKDGKSRPAVSDDERITKVGKFIRKTRIDELPQLINVLKGEMSLVGPRPERVEHVEKYEKEVPEFAFRLKVKGGLTGYAQVYGKYNTTPYDKLKYDLMYIENYSFLLDIQILIMTLKVVFMKESTEGFE